MLLQEEKYTRNFLYTFTIKKKIQALRDQRGIKTPSETKNKKKKEGSVEKHSSSNFYRDRTKAKKKKKKRKKREQNETSNLHGYFPQRRNVHFYHRATRFTRRPCTLFGNSVARIKSLIVFLSSFPFFLSLSPSQNRKKKRCSAW